MIADTSRCVHTLPKGTECLLIRFRRNQKAFQRNDLVMIALENVPDTCQHWYIIHAECSLPKELWGRGYVLTRKLFFKGFLIPSCNFLLRGGGKFLKVKTIKTLQCAALHWKTTAETGFAWFIQDKLIGISSQGNVQALSNDMFSYFEKKHSPKIVYSLTIEK